MDITQDLVERIAQLARLSLTQERKNDLCTQLKDILGNVADLDRLQLEEEPADEAERADALCPNELEQGGGKG